MKKTQEAANKEAVSLKMLAAIDYGDIHRAARILKVTPEKALAEFVKDARFGEALTNWVNSIDK